jgi:hypothetical protein
MELDMKDSQHYFRDLAKKLLSWFTRCSRQSNKAGEGDIVSIFGVCQVAVADRPNPVLVVLGRDQKGEHAWQLTFLIAQGLRTFHLNELALWRDDQGYAWVADAPESEEDRKKAACQLTRFLWKPRS